MARKNKSPQASAAPASELDQAVESLADFVKALNTAKTSSKEEFYAALEMKMGKKRARVACSDGYSVSAQANSFVYCEPRSNDGPYLSVELGFPTEADEAFLPYAEDANDPTGTVYARVPVSLVAMAFARRGGRALLPPYQIGFAVEHRLAKASDYAPNFDKTKPVRLALAQASAETVRDRLDFWAQAAVLGTLAEERAARFEIFKGSRRLLQWDQIVASALSAGDDSLCGGFARSAELIAERAAVDAAVVPPTPKSRRRKASL